MGGSVRDAILGPLQWRSGLHDGRQAGEGSGSAQGLGGQSSGDTGIEFGTISAIKHGQEIEITTFRADAYDRVSRNPIVEYGTTLADDLVRRDFTVNAMAMKIGADGSYTFVDPLNGMDAPVGRRARYAVGAGKLVQRTIRCGCCAQPGSSRSLVSR